ILIEYTRHVCRARLLEQEIAHFQQEWLAAVGGLERFDRLLAAADRETKAAIACARALRLTPQSQMHPRVGGRRLAELPLGDWAAPWAPLPVRRRRKVKNETNGAQTSGSDLPPGGETKPG